MILCNSAPALQHSDSSAPNSPINPPSAYPDALSALHSTMVRHRMLSRRGGSWGGSSRPQARQRSISDSSSSSAENPHYPSTRSGHGRAGLHFSGSGAEAVSSAPFPLPLHHTPHTTQFQFRSSLNRPIIVATISISFSEEAEQSILMTFSMDEMHRARLSRNRDKEEAQGGNGGRNKRNGKAVVGSLHEELEPQNDTQAVESRMMDALDPQRDAGSREGEQRGMGQTKSDNPDDWACPIVDEPTTEDFTTPVTNARWHFT